MSDTRSRHLVGHLRRHGIAYAALAVAFSFSPVPSMAAGMVTTSDIANGAVTRPKLATDSVLSTKILNDSIFGVDIKNGDIANVDLGPSSVNGPKVADESLTGGDIANDSITRFDIGQGQVDGHNLLDGTIADEDLGFGSVSSDAIANGTITGGDVANGTITGAHINLFNDNRCTLEALLGTALINADPAVPSTYTTDWIGYPHSCSGQTVLVRRAAAGNYSITFGGGNPARLAVVTQNTCCGDQASAVISVEALNPGQFFVQTKVNGSYADVDFTIVVL